jgi:anti-sigma factor RsiW
VKHDEVTCKRLILEYLIDYEDGSMPEPDRRRLEEHFSHCPPCVVFLSSYRATGRTLKMLKPREIPKNLAEAVLRFVRERCDKKS